MMSWTTRGHEVADPDHLADREIRNAKRRAAWSAGNTEHREQRRFVAWARRRGLTIWHTPNQLSARNRRRGAINKLLGVEAGVADLIIADRVPGRPDIRGLAIEMKGRGAVSPAQERWADTMRNHGWQVHVAYSCKQAQEIVTGLGL